MAPYTQWGRVREPGGDSAQRAALADRERELAYCSRLGYTHATYGLDPELYAHLAKRDGRIVLLSGAEPTGTDSSLAAARRAAARHGLGLIPQLPCLSHMDAFIRWIDPGASEFPDTAAFARFCAAKGLQGDLAALNHVAAAARNPAADSFFAIQLRLVKRAWRDDPRGAPGYIHIGHDELGFDSVCFVKAGRTRSEPGTRAELVAAEIALRARQIASILGDSVRILIYGDSFLPTDLGERYGLAGKAGTGEGGVLWLLRHRYHLERKLIVMPWNYLLSDGETHYWSRLRYSKGRQLDLLDKLGFGYVPGPGEHGSGLGTSAGLQPPFALGAPQPAIRCLAEWVREARRRPRNLRGFADQIFEPYRLCGPDSLCAGFTAPLLAYAAWIRPDPPPGAIFNLTAADLARIDYRRSRREGEWKAGVHFPGSAGSPGPAPR